MNHEMVVSGEVTLAVYRWGDPARPTLVLVHGYPDTAAMWRPVAELLADRYHVVAYDVRGAGSSSAPAATAAYRLDRLVEDLAAVVDHASPDGPIHLVGHDWGSILGWEAVSTERLAGRISSYTSVYAPGLDHAAHWARHRLRHPTPRHVKQLADQQLRSWYVAAFQLPGAALGWRAFGSHWPGFQHRVEKVAPSADYPAPTAPADGARGVALYRANFATRLARPAHRHTAVPVQVIVPLHDHYVSPALSHGLERWAPRLWRSEIDAGHWVPRTHPELVARWISEFVDHIDGGPESPRLKRSRAPAPQAIKARRVTFDWTATPLHWVPGDAFTTHVINVLHLLLPAGEKWFCDVFRHALPEIRDDHLRDQVKGFIGQESVHARAHATVLDRLAVDGLDTRQYTSKIDWLFARVLGEHPLGAHPPLRLLRRQWLVFRLAIIAAVEHCTSVLGWWALSASDALDQAGADPTMLDLLRWHGAEEVEHRAVAFDLFEHLRGGYVRRAVAMAGVLPILVSLWMAGTRYLMRHDPTVAPTDTASLRRFVTVARTGRLPSVAYLARAVPPYLRPGFHPSRHASTEAALAYLARSPAANQHATVGNQEIVGR
jgi:predicted metal-dependent hydrolase/pimeloyl-ACP methyl ester carboxylesterase